MAGAPAISPDGKIVALVAIAGGHRHIWIRLRAGGTPLQITRDNADHDDPRWTPDSSALICYTPSARSTTGSLSLVSALGGPSRRLGDALGGGDVSHDGRRVAFFARSGDEIALTVSSLEGSSSQAIVRVPSDSLITGRGGRRTIGRFHSSAFRFPSTPRSTWCPWPAARSARSRAPRGLPATHGFPTAPASSTARGRAARCCTRHRTTCVLLLPPHVSRSPDGRLLCLPLLDSTTANIWLVPTDGSAMRAVTDFGDRSVFIARWVSWSPDSRFVYAAVAETDADIVLLNGLLS